jgi:hypothetical protein
VGWRAYHCRAGAVNHSISRGAAGAVSPRVEFHDQRSSDLRTDETLWSAAGRSPRGALRPRWLGGAASGRSRRSAAGCGALAGGGALHARRPIRTATPRPPPRVRAGRRGPTARRSRSLGRTSLALGTGNLSRSPPLLGPARPSLGALSHLALPVLHHLARHLAAPNAPARSLSASCQVPEAPESASTRPPHPPDAHHPMAAAAAKAGALSTDLRSVDPAGSLHLVRDAHPRVQASAVPPRRRVVARMDDPGQRGSDGARSPPHRSAAGSPRRRGVEAERSSRAPALDGDAGVRRAERLPGCPGPTPHLCSSTHSLPSPVPQVVTPSAWSGRCR